MSCCHIIHAVHCFKPWTLNFHAGPPSHELKDSAHYVQGVAWDPLGVFVVSQSGDKTCRVYSQTSTNSGGRKQKGKAVGAMGMESFRCQHVIAKATLAVSAGEALPAASADGPPKVQPTDDAQAHSISRHKTSFVSYSQFSEMWRGECVAVIAEVKLSSAAGGGGQVRHVSR